MAPGKESKNLKEDQSREPDPAQEPEPSTSTGSRASRPRRGRPTGANRTPLSLEERRARNAQYERERRQELAEGHRLLAEAAGFDTNLPLADLLPAVIDKLEKAIDAAQRCTSSEDLEREIAGLEAEITEYVVHLPADFVLPADDEDEVPVPGGNNARKRKPSHTDTIGDEKRMRLGGAHMPAVGWISPADLAEAGPSTSPPPSAPPLQQNPTTAEDLEDALEIFERLASAPVSLEELERDIDYEDLVFAQPESTPHPPLSPPHQCFPPK